MSERVPSGWRASNLGDLASKIEGGGTPSRTVPEYWGGDIPWATVKDLKGARVTSTLESITRIGLEKSASKLVPANTMIIASRMAVGKAVIFNKDVAINQDLKAFFPKKILETQYLLQWYLSKAEVIESLGTGSTVKGIKLDDIRTLPIDLPPLPEQRKIAAILTSVDSVIEQTQAQIDKLKMLKTGMMQELLSPTPDNYRTADGKVAFKDSPLGPIPEKWEVRVFSSCCELMTNGYVGATRDIYRESGVPYVLCQNVRPGNFVETTYKFVSEEFHRKNSRSRLICGDVLTVQTGAGNGESCVVPKSYDGANCHALIISRVRAGILEPHFLAAILNSDFGRSRVNIIATGGAHPHLNTTDLKKEFLPVPPISEQQHIVSVLSSINRKIIAIASKLERHKQTKKALMQDLLTGKVRVNTDA